MSRKLKSILYFTTGLHKRLDVPNQLIMYETRKFLFSGALKTFHLF